MHMTTVECTGNEDSLINCANKQELGYCHYSSFVWMQCDGDECTDNDVGIAGDPNATEG